MRNSLVFVFFFTAITSWAQVNRYVVHFSDKDNSAYTVSSPEAFLSERAIIRRSSQDILITKQDFPVNATYVQAVENVSPAIEVYFSSRWMNNILIQCEAAMVDEIASLPFVTEVEYVAPGGKLSAADGSSSRRFRKRSKKVQSAATDLQNQMLGIDAMHSQGYTGKDVWVAVMDGGFEGVNGNSHFQHLFSNNQVKYVYDYVTNSTDVYRYTDHGTKVLSLMAAHSPGEFVGGAYDATYLLFVTEDDCNACEHRIEEYNWLYAAEFADSAGVDIINTSLGYSTFEDPDMDYTFEDLDGKTAVISIANDIAASKGILVISSAGNEGTNSWGYITAPADGHKVLSVGNVDLAGNRWRSSSHGYAADGRIKPDLAAPGAGVAVVNRSGNIVGGTGTSFSSPMVAGLAAGVRQAYPEMTTTDLRFFLQQSANQASAPDSLLGYGIPNFEGFASLLAFTSKPEQFTVYPNPINSSIITVRVNNPDEVSASQLKVFDSSGHLVLERSLSFSWQNLSHAVDMQTLRAGVYIFNLDTGARIDQIRVVKI